jgi:hypothetical protein
MAPGTRWNPLMQECCFCVILAQISSTPTAHQAKSLRAEARSRSGLYPHFLQAAWYREASVVCVRVPKMGVSTRVREVEKEIDAEIRALKIWQRSRASVLHDFMRTYRDAIELIFLELHFFQLHSESLGATSAKATVRSLSS